jgi:hypothetical protein
MEPGLIFGIGFGIETKVSVFFKELKSHNWNWIWKFWGNK